MKYLLILLLLFVVCRAALAQADSLRLKENGDSLKVKRNGEMPKKKEGELKLSDSFLKSLEGAFSFDPVAAPLTKQNELTVEQLHEWVGKPTAQDSINYFRSFNAPKASKFDAAYKAAKMWEKEFYVPVDLGKPEIFFDLGPMPNPNKGKAIFDFNALGQYIRPKEIKMRKLRTRAQKHLKELDELYPVLIEK